jgi:hypothetical protein
MDSADPEYRDVTRALVPAPSSRPAPPIMITAAVRRALGYGAGADRPVRPHRRCRVWAEPKGQPHCRDSYGREAITAGGRRRQSAALALIVPTGTVALAHRRGWQRRRRVGRTRAIACDDARQEPAGRRSGWLRARYASDLSAPDVLRKAPGQRHSPASDDFRFDAKRGARRPDAPNACIARCQCQPTPAHHSRPPDWLR